MADISDPMASSSLGGPSKRAATMKAEVDDDHDEAMFQAAFPECPEIVTPKPVRRRTPGSPSPARTASGLQDDDGDEAKGESSTLMSEPAQSENATLQDRRLRMCVCVCVLASLLALRLRRPEPLSDTCVDVPLLRQQKGYRAQLGRFGSDFHAAWSCIPIYCVAIGSSQFRGKRQCYLGLRCQCCRCCSRRRRGGLEGAHLGVVIRFALGSDNHLASKVCVNTSSYMRTMGWLASRRPPKCKSCERGKPSHVRHRHFHNADEANYPRIAPGQRQRSVRFSSRGRASLRAWQELLVPLWRIWALGGGS